MSTYKFIELVGTSNQSWEDAARQAVQDARKTLRELRVAEVVQQDIKIVGESVFFRVRLKVSFKITSFGSAPEGVEVEPFGIEE
ncbi:MAG: hypothetical protein Kow0092_01130 [Deferrisomatales bacterium]